MAIPLVCVNKSGQTVPVWTGLDGNGQPYGKKGDIYDREVYAKTGAYIEGRGFYIRFRSPSGVVQDGYIEASSAPAGIDWNIHAYPYSQGYVEGVFYYFFNMQRSETIYNPDGTVWGTAAQGAWVAALGSQGGQSHPDWLQIYAVQRMPDRTWVRINPGQTYDWGFIPVGLEDGSMPATISLYGSW